MDLQITKEILIKRVESVEDIELLLSLNNMLDYGLKKQETEPAFLTSLERSLGQSTQGEGKPHQEVIEGLHKKYAP
jgi:hypothetical protein